MHRRFSGGHSEYWRVNSAINQVFFDGRFGDRPVYLDPDTSLRTELSKVLDCEEDEIGLLVGMVVADTLTPDKANLYAWHKSNAQIWNTKSEPPPFTALLYSFAIAAEHMRESEEFAQNNYYGRLAEVFGDLSLRGDVSDSGKHSKEFWVLLNRWLEENDFVFGRPTAQKITNLPYVSFPLSQALVREADREGFKKLFARYGFTSSDDISEAELEPYVDEWMSGHGPSSYLKRLWSNSGIRERIITAALQELEAWDGSLIEAGASSPSAQRLFWVLGLKKMPVKRASMFLCITSDPERFSTIQVDAVKVGAKACYAGTNGEFFSFADLPGIDAYYITPTPSIDRGRAMISSIEFGDNMGTRFQRNPRPIVPLALSATGHFYREVNQILLHGRYGILCHDNWRKRVGEYLDAYAKDGFKSLEGSKSGLPVGWTFYESVEIVAVPQVEIEKDLQDLVPLSKGADFHFSGGLNLSRDIWHTDVPPEVFASDGEKPLSIRVERGGIDDSALVKVNDSAAMPSFLRDPKLGLENQSYKLVAYEKRTIRKEKLLSFRTADTPKQHVRGDERYLNYILGDYGGVDFATPIDMKPNSLTMLAGMGWASPVPINIALSALEPRVKAKLPFVVSDHVEYELVEAETDYGDKATSSSIESCITRGVHIWQVPSGINKRSKEAIFHCGDCGASVLWKSKKNSQAERSWASLRLGQSTKIVAKLAGESPTANQVYDAICYHGFGSWHLLQRLLGYIVDEPWKVYEKAKEFVDLGFLDVQLDPQTRRPVAWSVPPPVMVLAEGRCFLAGFRCKFLLEQACEALNQLGAKFAGRDETGIPSQYVWTMGSFTVEHLQAQLVDVCDSRERPIETCSGLPEQLVSMLPGLSAMLSEFSETSMPIRGISKFDVGSGVWGKDDGMGRAGAYRFDGPPRKYYLVDSSGTARYSTFDISKISAARNCQVRLHDYDEERREFVSLMGCDLPGLYRRALVACSGELPVHGKNRTVCYSNVPVAVGNGILRKLYFEELT